MSVEFCDTNVFVYAYDRSAGAKHDQARRLLERLWGSGDGIVSVQVLQELYVTLIRKAAPPLAPPEARALVQDIAAWPVVEPGRQDVLAAIDAAQRWRIAFWDAMILTTAAKAGAAIVWSEDLSDGQTYDGTLVRNPFRSTP